MNFYPKINTNDFLSDGWYEFEDYKYRGELKDGYPVGKGKVIYNNGVEVEGIFKMGVLSDNNALIKIPRVGIFQGKVINGKLISGYVNYYNGDYYKGDFNKFKRDGKGMFVKTNGDFFIGDFKNEKLNGKGKFFSNADSTTIIGDFKNNKANGDILVTYGNGDYKGRIYNNGQDVTLEEIEKASAKKLEEKERKELDFYDDKLERIENKRRQEVESVKADMICDCVNDGLSDHYMSECFDLRPDLDRNDAIVWFQNRRFIDKQVEIDLIVSDQSNYRNNTSEEWKRKFLPISQQADKDYRFLKKECKKWYKERNNSKIKRICSTWCSGNYAKMNADSKKIKELREEAKRINAERNLAKKKQIQERAELMINYKAEEHKRLRDKVAEQNRQLEIFCASKPSHCSCAKINDVQTCISSKAKGACTCEI